ncbi:MAG: S9 family peptidase [Acidobacteriota bacterium]|nr:S9 family peptidase [Acidobacteriota bacterium]
MSRIVVAILVCTVASAAGARDRRAFSIEDFYRLTRPSGLDLSPDGTTLVYSLKSTDLPRARSNSDLYSVSTEGEDGRRLTFTDDVSETEPTYSPDGKTIAFAARRGEQENAQIWLLPADGGEATELTDFYPGVNDLEWSPDGRHIAFTSVVYPECGADSDCNRSRSERRDSGRIRAHVADELLHRHWDTWADGKVRHLFVVNVASGEIRDLTPGERESPAWSLEGGRGFDFSPDGREICFTRNPDPVETLAWSTNSDLWIVPVDASEGEPAAPRNITADNPAWDGNPRYSPDGRYLAYLTQEQPGYEADLFRLMVYERETGERKIMAPSFDNWILDLAWTSDSENIIFKAEHEMRTPLFAVHPRIGRARMKVDAAHIHEYIPSIDGRWAYVIRSAVGVPHEVWRVDIPGETPPQRLTEHNLAVEREVQLRQGLWYWVRGKDGRKTHALIIKPYEFDLEKKYPVIINVHGGPQSQWTTSFRGDWQMYTGAGYVVIFVNPTGSTGYGQEYTAAISKDWGGQVFEDLMSVVDQLEDFVYVDPKRIGAMGWSYGGYMMNWFQTKTDRFACLASMMGIFDLRSFYLSTEELWFPEWDFGGPPWESELYEKWSPSNYVEKFKTPTLFIGGELDFRVPYTQSLMGFTALRRKGIPARLIVLPEAGHWPDWYEMALYYTAHLEWFHRFLGGDPPPWSVEELANNAVFDAETGERIDEED